MKKTVITFAICCLSYGIYHIQKSSNLSTDTFNSLSSPVPGAVFEKHTIDPMLVDALAVDAEISMPLVDAYNSDPVLSQKLWANEDREPKVRLGGYRYKKVDLTDQPKPLPNVQRSGFDFTSNTASVSVFDAAGQIANLNNAGNLFIPADSHGAVGDNHVMNVINVSMEIYNKNGSGGSSTSLQSFFAPLLPVNATFDPKVLYDQFADRWVVVTLERTDTSLGDTTNSSRVLLAVSDDSNPNGLWFMVSVNTLTNINGVNHWFDYPGFAVDEEAIYLTGNMFEFGQGGGVGSRLWIFEKSSFYAGGNLTGFGPLDPFAATNGINVTAQPAHVFGSSPIGFGTYLTGYSSLTDGTDEFWQTIRIDNPLTNPFFTLEFINVGNVEPSNSSLPEAPQAGSATNTGANLNIATNNSRALNAVWMDNKLYSAASVQSNQQLGQTSASWVEINANGINATSLEQFGVVFGEEIANNTFTFFPSIAVNSSGVVGLGFSASAPSIFAGSYFTYRLPG